MIKIYGYSDDTVIVEGSGKYDEIGCFDSDVKIKFKDGSEAMIHYGKTIKGEKKGIWEININNCTAAMALHICTGEDDEVYSDILTIASEINSVEVITL